MKKKRFVILFLLIIVIVFFIKIISYSDLEDLEQKWGIDLGGVTDKDIVFAEKSSTGPHGEYTQYYEINMKEKKAADSIFLKNNTTVKDNGDWGHANNIRNLEDFKILVADTLELDDMQNVLKREGMNFTSDCKYLVIPDLDNYLCLWLIPEKSTLYVLEVIF